jgi:hypothetical protein
LAQGQGIYSISEAEGPLRQGEILSNLEQYNLVVSSIDDPTPQVAPKKHPWVIVLSQDCDLDQDFKQRFQKASYPDKDFPLIPNILFCEVSEASKIRWSAGGGITSKIWTSIKQNNNIRYEFLEKIPTDKDYMGNGIPELVIDFKSFFTLPTEEVYTFLEKKKVKRHSGLNSPYLEHLTSRFFFYQSRVGLEPGHISESSEA